MWHVFEEIRALSKESLFSLPHRKQVFWDLLHQNGWGDFPPSLPNTLDGLAPAQEVVWETWVQIRTRQNRLPLLSGPVWENDRDLARSNWLSTDGWKWARYLGYSLSRYRPEAARLEWLHTSLRFYDQAFRGWNKADDRTWWAERGHPVWRVFPAWLALRRCGA